MNIVMARGVSNGSAASCKHESHEGGSHARSTAETNSLRIPWARYMVPAVWYFVASGHTVSQDLPGMARHVYPGLLSEYLALTAACTSTGPLTLEGGS